MRQNTLFLKKFAHDELYSFVDQIVDLIRTAVDYKLILVLLFLKRIRFF
ncbi:MAG: hypothetical protein QXJ17_03085 [Nitrososphaeria archaeon]